MKYTFTSYWGNFAYRMSAELPDGTPEWVCAEALANMSYRLAGSRVDKALGVKKDGKAASRRDVEYSVEDAERINAAVSAAIVEWEGKPEAGAAERKAAKLSFAVTGKHEFGVEGASPMAMATALVDGAMGTGSEKGLRDLLSMMGLAGASDAGREALIAFANSKGLGIRAKK